MIKFFKVYRAEWDLDSGTQFRETDFAHQVQAESIAVAVNRCGQEQERLAKEGKKTIVTSSIYDGRIVFTVESTGRNARVIIRYGVDLQPTA